MTNATATMTVREVALENPAATRVFEKLGIDYCCGGHKPLAEACHDANLSYDSVLAELEQARHDVEARTSQKEFQALSLTELIEHINSSHHVFVRTEVPRIELLLAKVVGKRGPMHPELYEIQRIFSDLGQELAGHLMKEEQILFPYVSAMEESVTTGRPMPPAGCFGTVQNPVRMMVLEHDNAGSALRELRQVSGNYTLPEDACTSYRALFTALQEFEADLHQHIHLENNILFPRALEMESRGQ